MEILHMYTQLGHREGTGTEKEGEMRCHSFILFKNRFNTVQIFYIPQFFCKTRKQSLKDKFIFPSNELLFCLIFFQPFPGKKFEFVVPLFSFLSLFPLNQTEKPFIFPPIFIFSNFSVITLWINTIIPSIPWALTIVVQRLNFTSVAQNLHFSYELYITKQQSKPKLNK